MQSQKQQQRKMFAYPPDFTKAQLHRKATRIFKGVEKDPDCMECECCSRRVGIDEVGSSCCYSKDELAFLGPGVPLLFTYIRNSIWILLALTAVFGVFGLYSNAASDYCAEAATNCENSDFNTISFSNKLNRPEYLEVQNYVLLAFVVLNIGLFQWIRYNFRKVEERCDDIIDSPSDYSIILRRLPPDTQEKDIEKMVAERRQTLSQEEKKTTLDLKIDHIVMSYSLSEYTKINTENLDSFRKSVEENRHKDFTPVPLPKLSETASVAVVVFSRQESKQMFVYRPSIIQKSLQCLCTPCTPLSEFRVRDSKISIERAPEPDDIIWENTKISMEGAILRKTIFNILGVLLLLGGGGVQYGLALLQNQTEDEATKQLLSVSLSLVIAAFNFIILQFLVLTSVKERNETQTEFNTVLTVKISFFQFLNTGIFVVGANFLADVDNFSITQGMAFEVCLVMIVNSVTYNLSLWVLNYFEVIGKVMRLLVECEWLVLTQSEVNRLWQAPPDEIPYKYGFVLKTIWLTAFYSPFSPVVVPISMAGLAVNFYIEKYLYRYVYSAPNMLSSMVNDSAIELMEYFPLILSLGDFFLYFYILDYDAVEMPAKWAIPIYVSIGLSLLNLVLPMDDLNHKLFTLEIDGTVFPSYEEVEEKFQVTYEMTNPAYECKKKRNRDKFLLNKLFGGQGQKVAQNHFAAFIAPTDRTEVKESLLKKDPTPLNKAASESEAKDETAEDNPFAGLLQKKESTKTQGKPVNEDQIKLVTESEDKKEESPKALFKSKTKDLHFTGGYGKNRKEPEVKRIVEEENQSSSSSDEGQNIQKAFISRSVNEISHSQMKKTSQEMILFQKPEKIRQVQGFKHFPQVSIHIPVKDKPKKTGVRQVI